MNKWKSKLIAVVTALCMALSVPVFAGSASVYVATQTATCSENKQTAAAKGNLCGGFSVLKINKKDTHS